MKAIPVTTRKGARTAKDQAELNRLKSLGYTQ
jgi:hypothetical protein